MTPPLPENLRYYVLNSQKVSFPPELYNVTHRVTKAPLMRVSEFNTDYH